MKKLLIALCLMIPVVSFASYNVIPIATSVVMADGTINTISGTISGVSVAPVGDYRIKITNGKGFKGKSYSKMYCTIVKKDSIKNKGVPLLTVFSRNGKLYSVTGFYTGMGDFYPVNGYQVIVKNGKNKDEWNTMNCRIE